jgi:hypothetical protein
LLGLTEKDGVFSLWKGQRPTKFCRYVALDDIDDVDPVEQLLLEIVRDHAPAPSSRCLLAPPSALNPAAGGGVRGRL